MAEKGGGGGHGDDSKYIVFMVLIIGGGWVIWHILKAYFLWVTLGINLLEYKLLGYAGLLDNVGIATMDRLQAVHSFLFSPNSKVVLEKTSWSDFMYIQHDIGSRLKWFWIIIGSCLTGLVLFRMKGDGFKKQYSLTGRNKVAVFRFLGMRINSNILKKVIYYPCRYVLFLHNTLISEKKEWINSGTSLAMYQSQYWREALTGAMFDPDANEPNMRPSLIPPEWMREHGISLKKGILDEAKAISVFKLQVEDNWAGLKSASLHVQAIMILSALNVTRDKRLNGLRARLTECYILRPKLVEKEVKELLEPFLNDTSVTTKIEKRAAKHAFANTACVALYGWGGPIESWGGRGGVLSSSLFLWLKRIDRPLWYALNNVGRRQFHIEGAGTIFHFFIERMHKLPVSNPSADNALRGLIKYLSDHSITDLDEYFNRDLDD